RSEGGVHLNTQLPKHVKPSREFIVQSAPSGTESTHSPVSRRFSPWRARRCLLLVAGRHAHEPGGPRLPASRNRVRRRASCTAPSAHGGALRRDVGPHQARRRVGARSLSWILVLDSLREGS